MSVSITLSPGRVIRPLGAAIATLAFGHLFAACAKFQFGLGGPAITQWLDLGNEQSLGSLLALLEWFACVGLLATMVRYQRTQGRASAHWSGLLLIFVFLAVDDFVSFHEGLSGKIQRAFDTTSYFYFAWVIPYGIAVMLLAATYLRFLLKLPAITRTLFVLAAFVFVSGAIGVETLEGRLAEHHGIHNLHFALLVNLEELLEMSGLAIFLYALVDHLAGQVKLASVRFEP
jgi:hypothetical protein